MSPTRILFLLVVMACERANDAGPAAPAEPAAPVSSTAPAAVSSTAPAAPAAPVSPEDVPVITDDSPKYPPKITKKHMDGMLAKGRDGWQQPDKVLSTLAFRPGEIVADVGSGAGYFTFRLAEAVGPTGKVYAIDFDANVIAELQRQVSTRGTKNVALVHNPIHDILLEPASVDTAFLVDVHNFIETGESPDSPMAREVPEFYKSIARALKPDGRMVIVEARHDQGNGRGVNAEEIAQQVAVAGFKLQTSYDFLERQYFLVFGTP